MPSSLNGTGVTFSDATTQSTAATAAALVTTTNVLNATASASVGAVGTYAFLGETTNNVSTTPGSTRAASTLRYVGINRTNDPWSIASGLPTTVQAPSGFTTAPSGTWRAMGWAKYATDNCGTPQLPATVWLRIS